MDNMVFTVGHSTVPIEDFLALLGRHGIGAIGDVRSQPYSRMCPQFNQGAIGPPLATAGIAYVYLGRELGARPADRTCFAGGKVSFDRLAATDSFRQGLDRVLKGMQKYRLALMCAEKDPLGCHRAILVARRLEERGVAVRHILADGRLESHEALVERMLQKYGLHEEDLFKTREERIAEAYERQGAAIAYQEATGDGQDHWTDEMETGE